MEKLQVQLTAILNLLNIKIFRVLLFLLIGIVMYAAMYSNVKPEKLNLELFSVAEQTIRSPITIEDKESTEASRRDAVEQVKDVYNVKLEYTQNRVDLITSIFGSVSEVNDEAEEKVNQEKKDAEGTEVENKATPSEPTIEEKLATLKTKLTESETKSLADKVFIPLLQASNEELLIAKDLTVTAINNVMKNRIPADEVENAKKRVEEELKYTSLNGSLKDAVIEIGRYAIVQNEFYDPEATEFLRQQAMDGVETVRILEGQILVDEGQLISREIYKKLQLVGLLESENSYMPFIGLAMMVALILFALYIIFNEMESADKKQKNLLIFSFIFITSILLMKLVSLFDEFEYSEIGYIFPAAMGAMLIKILINERLALFQMAILAISGTIIFNEGITGTLNVSLGIYILISGLAAILFLQKQNRRSKVLQAGLFVSAINLIAILSMLFLRNSQFSGLEYGFYIIAAFVSGITSAVLTIGLLPFFEAGFGILSTLRMIELSNPNHPLLRKILTEAPGTYHHSVMVANLSEAACEAIGANGLLARVGCYYHDIGKTKRPQFFIENQINMDNPHDKLPALTSKNIIIAHATDGAEMLRKHRMPKEIIDIAEQHHGTTLLKFFYHKAKQAGHEVKEEDFRYPGPKPQTKESAVIGIADSVEAAVRSMAHPTHEQIETLVHNIIADRLQDGQLSECDITLKELDTVADTLCETLKGIFHSRIEYPEMNKQKVKQA
ncbi:HD family phosphohydrolase [Mesobacillus subterraneus]|uniref:HD family phosphohydrolase n=1 Tax=Mesobacillus subterraneus TaxID=285983 RepID=UPI0020424EC3|nr:HD family phosphohydrolase [Mesobacillus subterraneus]MCM3663963.1 HD family phosphohydrolase [Mesobacillus subterraneus]MCM3683722.1 HD family phosphohydrolase [Mesobacillus subterraneus]